MIVTAGRIAAAAVAVGGRHGDTPVVCGCRSVTCILKIFRFFRF